MNHLEVRGQYLRSVVDRPLSARSPHTPQALIQWIIKYFIQSEQPQLLKLRTSHPSTQHPVLAQGCSPEREAPGIQFPHTDNRGELVSSSFLSKWCYPSDWILGETGITAASLLCIMCFLVFYVEHLKVSTPFRTGWNLSKEEDWREGEGKERRFLYSEMKLN